MCLIETMENLINVDVPLKTNETTYIIHVIKVIGEGKTSTVYLVKYGDAQYALKVQTDPINSSVFKTSNLCNCLPYVHQYGVIGYSYGTLMEYYPNAKPLTRVMFRNSDMLSCGTIFRIGLILLQQLKQLHDNGLEYIDLRPPNIACIKACKDTSCKDTSCKDTSCIKASKDTACIKPSKDVTFKLYDVDAVRYPSKTYTEKVGKQHESFYSCFEKKHTYIDDLCSLIFVLITMFGGTFWSFKNIASLAKTGNPFFTRFNQLYELENADGHNRIYSKYDCSPFKIEYRRLINCIKVNVYNKIVGDIHEILKASPDHETLRDLIHDNFYTIHNRLCKKYLTTTEIKYRSIVGLYILAIYLTECSYMNIQKCAYSDEHTQKCAYSDEQYTNIIDDSIYTFIDTTLRYLNIAKITQLDKIILYYDHKVKLQLFNIDDIYK